MERSRDRAQAGQELAKRLSAYAGRPDVLVLGLPRGGIPVAYQVAKSLNAPLDVFVVRKLGVPGEEELAMGAIAANGVRVINEDVVRSLGLTRQAVDAAAAREQRELERREREYRGDKPPIDARGRIVILVDDGLATGATMRAAAQAIRRQEPSKVVIAVPVAAMETCQALREEADEVICALAPEVFYAVGLWYDDFSQTTDREVQELLRMAGNP
jgi:putative phosphoribosyl transferase